MSDASTRRCGPLRRVLLADIAHRSRTMTPAGVGATFSSLHERGDLGRDRGRVRLLDFTAVVDCEGIGLTLVPTVMGSPFCS